MTGELVYEIARYDVGMAAQTLIERFRLHRDGGVDPAALIAADAELNEVRANQITRITAAQEIAAVLPLVLIAPGDSRDVRVLYVNGNRWAPFPGPSGVNHLLPEHCSTVALAQSWLRLSFVEAGRTVPGQHATELGLATPAVAADAGQPTVRVWRRDATPGGDARIVLSWLQANALSDRLGIDTGMLVQLFIEATADPANPPRGGQVWDGEFLADLAGAAESAGTTPGSQWRLTVRLAPDAVEAVLDAIADSSPQRRYAIIAARDPESPAGRVRRTVLADDGSVGSVAASKTTEQGGEPVQAREKVLITAAELADLIQAGEPVTILDVRWRLDEPDGRAAYLQGHLPGAVYVSLEDELSDHTVAGRGRHPLPTGRNLEAAARRWGVRREKLVVAYDDWNRIGSGRAWWLLTTSGLTNVRILDGGLPAWRAAGGALETGEVTAQPGNVTLLHEDLYDGSRPTLTAEQAGAGGVTLLDARPPERFRGDGEAPDAVAGHIPGAKNLPCTALLAGDGTFLGDDALTGLLSDRHVDCGDSSTPVGAYCGSGVSATVVVAALAALGHNAALYPGSWSEWSSDPTHAVARGPE